MLAILIAFLSAFIVTSIIQLADKTSIISLRRTLAFFFISTMIWLFTFGAGTAYSILTKNSLSTLDAFLFGGFLVIGFELVVINGAFLRSTPKSLGLAIIHPLSIFAVILPKIDTNNFSTLNYVLPSITGLTAIATMLVFLRKLNNNFNTKHGITPLQLLQAFLKTWVTQRPTELEKYFERYSVKQSVQTKILHFLVRGKKVSIILPDIHPGPFYPVGSYNLSETIFRKLKRDDSIPMILHGTGGHERNLPKNEYTDRYAERLADFVGTLTPNQSQGLKGPIQRRLGATSVTAITFGNEVLATVSRAPFNSDDLDPLTINGASLVANECGLNLTLVDAHNSIGGTEASHKEINKEDWVSLFDGIKSSEEQNFKLGYAHTSEIDFEHSSDISEGGIGVVIFETNNSQGALIIADSNNARVGLRETLKKELNDMGVTLLELCTSDTHNLAARSLINRGYYALGEATHMHKIVEIIKKLVEMARERLDKCQYTVANFSTEIPLIGTESLNDFATLTNTVTNFTKNFFKKAIPFTLVLLAIAIFY